MKNPVYPVSHTLWGGDPLFCHSLLSLDLFLSWASLNPRAHNQQLKTAKVPFGCCHRCEDSRLESVRTVRSAGLPSLGFSVAHSAVLFRGRASLLLGPTLPCKLQASCPTCCWVNLLSLLPIPCRMLGLQMCPAGFYLFIWALGIRLRLSALCGKCFPHPSYTFNSLQ